MLTLLAQSPAAFIALALVVGLVVGSFLNVVIYRLPIMLERQWRQQCAEFSAGGAAPAANSGAGADAADPPFNLVVPRSTCPACKTPITAWQNIPLISFLALRGRCAHCKTRISARYPLVEALTGIACAVVAWHFGFGWPAVFGIVITWFLVAMTFIDLDHQLLPDSLTLPLLWLGLLVAAIKPTGALTAIDPAGAIIGAVAGYLCLWVVYHLFRLATGKEGMGHGDFKLLAALGAWLGWRMLLPIVLFAAVVGALTGIALILSRRQQRGQPIPFGPFLAAAGWIVMLWGQELVTGYLGLYRHG